MKVYFFIISLFCLSYYGIIRHYTGKWNSTFAGFWLLAAICHGMGLAVWKYLPGNAKMVILGILIFLWSWFLYTEWKIIRYMRQSPVDDATDLIVLGAHVNGTKITNSLKRRLDAAVEYWRCHPKTRIIVSGGQGKGEDTTEARAMAEYLYSQGIPKKLVLLEETSTTTVENLKFSAKMVQNLDLEQKESLLERRVLIATNNFHVYRALCIAKKIGYRDAHGLSASSNPVLQMNYLVREFFALIMMKIRR